MFAQHPLMEVLVKLFQKYVGYWGNAPNRATQSAKLLYFIRIQGQRPWSSTADVEILFLCGCQLYFILSIYHASCIRTVSAKLRLFILSFCRSVKESIKESAFGRRQELPAGTEADPLCQPLKWGADYRDVTAALKMKRQRRLCGERFTFFAVAMMFHPKRRRERGLVAV